MTTRVVIVVTTAVVGAVNLPLGAVVGALLVWQLRGEQ